jgi:hypothetical protein
VQRRHRCQRGSDFIRHEQTRQDKITCLGLLPDRFKLSASDYQIRCPDKSERRQWDRLWQGSIEQVPAAYADRGQVGVVFGQVAHVLYPAFTYRVILKKAVSLPMEMPC